MTTEAMAIPSGYVLRRPSRDDIPAILALIAALDIAYTGTADGWTEEDILEGWQRLDLQRDSFLITAPDGSLAGYADAQDAGSGHLNIDGYVHPAHWGRGIGTALVRLAEARLRERVPLAPEGARVVISNGVMVNDEAAHRLLEGEGYRLVRGFWRMAIELEAEPEAPVWPSGITLRTLQPGRDERAVFECVEEAFQDHWGHVPRPFEQWIARTSRSDFDPSLWLLAETERGELAGVALNARRPGCGWVNTLAVRRPWRRQGLGMALLRQAFVELWRRGERVVDLGVDAQSLTGATRLYEQAGMRVAAQYALFEKELRPGVDLSTRSLD
jgi:mycothiol synthase